MTQFIMYYSDNDNNDEVQNRISLDKSQYR